MAAATRPRTDGGKAVYVTKTLKSQAIMQALASVPWDEEEFEGMTEEEMEARSSWHYDEDYQEQLLELSEASFDDILTGAIDDLDQLSVVCQAKAVLDAKRSKLPSHKSG